MAFSPARPNLEVWFPRAGWLPVNKESGEVMELVMAMPMLLLTLSIVPIEIVERFFPHLVLKYPAVAIALHLLGALIWIAFVVEFVMLFGVAQNKIDYCKRHWVNLIIIILPLIAFLRVLRITRIVRIIRAGKLMRVYRIRGVYVRALRVAVLFSLVDRLLNRKPEKYLTKLEEQIADKQKELAELEENAEELRGEIKQLAEVNPQ
jgi:voltage-gated potassium channel